MSAHYNELWLIVNFIELWLILLAYIIHLHLQAFIGKLREGDFGDPNVPRCVFLSVIDLSLM